MNNIRINTVEIVSNLANIKSKHRIENKNSLRGTNTTSYFSFKRIASLHIAKPISTNTTTGVTYPNKTTEPNTFRQIETKRNPVELDTQINTIEEDTTEEKKTK